MGAEGLFHSRSAAGWRGGRAKIWTAKNIAVLCDVIADGGTFADAAKACKVSEMQARGRFGSIVRAMGWQAR